MLLGRYATNKQQHQCRKCTISTVCYRGNIEQNSTCRGNMEQNSTCTEATWNRTARAQRQHGTEQHVHRGNMEQNSACTYLSRSVPERPRHVAGTLSNRQTTTSMSQMHHLNCLLQREQLSSRSTPHAANSAVGSFSDHRLHQADSQHRNPDASTVLPLRWSSGRKSASRARDAWFESRFC